MRRWFSSFIPADQKHEPVKPPAPPMAGPSGQPAGIDHLIAHKRPADETAEAPAEDPYDSLMPVRRLAAATSLLLEPPAPPEFKPADVSAKIANPMPDADAHAAASAQDVMPEEGLAETCEPEAATAPSATEHVPVAAINTPRVSEPPAAAPEPAQLPAPAHPPDKVPPVRWDTLQAIAQKAMQQGDPAIAAGWWWLMRLAFPTMFYGYTDGALALAGLGRFDEGRQLLDEAATHIQEEPAIPVTRAILEARAGNMDASIEGWREATLLPASTAWICGRLIDALEQQSRHDEVDAVLGQAVHLPRFQHPALLAKAVSIAVQRKDWPAVAERLVTFGNAAPLDQTLGIDLDKILVSLRNNDPAGLATVTQAAWIGPAIASVETEPYRLIGQARLAQLCGRLADCMARLATLRPVMPQTSDAYLRVEAILRDAGSLAAADAILAEAKGHFQQDIDIWIRIGDVTEARSDWGAAVAHWTAAGKAFPGHAYPGYRYQQAALRLHDETPDSEMPEIAETTQSSGEGDLRDLALSFESLGGTGVAGGCEFGGIQRAWGAEPLGLFRWSTVSPSTLIACLEQRFDGIGNEATTSLFQSNESSTLLWEIRDERYGYEMHSFIPVAGMPQEVMMRTAGRRMRYLADKLLRDLENPAKIFVFKVAERRFEPSEIEGLCRGLAQYPGMRLLCVCPADADHTAEAIETIAPGLMVASMDFSAGHDWAPRIAAWEAICRRVLAEWQPAQPADAVL